MNHKIIVFEGCDCAGKTSLKRAFDIETKHEHLIIDRFFISNIVYNKLKKRGKFWEKEYALEEDLFQFIDTHSCLFVIRHPSFSTICRRFDDRGDWYIVRDELSFIYECYTAWCKRMQDHKNFLILDDDHEIKTHVQHVMARVNTL